MLLVVVLFFLQDCVVLFVGCDDAGELLDIVRIGRKAA